MNQNKYIVEGLCEDIVDDIAEDALLHLRRQISKALGPVLKENGIQVIELYVAKKVSEEGTYVCNINSDVAELKEKFKEEAWGMFKDYERKK